MLPGQYYHVYNHANGDDDLFKDQENYRWFLQKYHQYISPIAETYAYCLMPNHFHFLLRLKDSFTLLQTFPKFETLEKLENSALPGKQFSNLFSSYTQAFNKRYNRKGSLFLKNFKRRMVDSDNYLSLVIAYIHLNPVLHGFASSPECWKWSSYESILSNSHTLLQREAVIKWFGGHNAFVGFHKQYYAAKFPEIQVLDHWFKQ